MDKGRIITRRGLLLGLGAAAASTVIAPPEPVRRFWQASGNAPVPARGPYSNNLPPGTQPLFRSAGMMKLREELEKLRRPPGIQLFGNPHPSEYTDTRGEWWAETSRTYQPLDLNVAGTTALIMLPIYAFGGK